MKISKLLIANRGEIAVRIIRTARELGIATVAVYSEADSTALHVIMADEAHPLGPAEAKASYLNQDKILAVAKKARVDAIHPGYGFFAEDADFASACTAAGIRFIGPTAKNIFEMGDKLRARDIAKAAGLSIVPGTPKITEVGQAETFMRKLGKPVLIKCAAGGGGHGMRRVAELKQLESALRLTGSEGSKAFGDETLYLEAALSRPQHIEVQIFGLGDGRALSLGTRACSVQRRNQKIVEEAPAAGLPAAQLEQITTDAKKLAQAMDYLGAGTVEFLVDDSGQHYFLEMNTRLQVEHPVTEMNYGIDLVAWQLKLSMGLSQGCFHSPDLRPLGHAIECRLYAENPLMQFAPAPGKIELIRFPSGPFIRVDSGIYPGYTIPIEYDPLIAKISAWGQTREEARRRMLRALDETLLLGTTTNLALLKLILTTPSFKSGNYSTELINAEKLLESLKTSRSLSTDLTLVLAAHMQPPTDQPLPSTSRALSAWQQSLPSGGLIEN